MADYTSTHTGAVIDSAITKAAKLASISGGDALKVPRVNSGETAQELIAAGTIVAAAIVAASAKATPVDADTVPLIDSADSSALKEVTVANLKTLIMNATDLATVMVAASAKTTLVNADSIPVIDSEDSDALKEVTLANILAYTGTPLTLRQHNRALFARKSTTEIYLSGGRYFHSGTTDQYIYFNSQLTYEFTGLTASAWHYLYADDSAIVTHASGLIRSNELTEDTTAPSAYDPTKGGCYHPTNTNDMCLFAALTNADSEIIEFHHVDNMIMFDEQITSVARFDIDTTWTDMILDAPGFCNNVNVTFNTDPAGQSGSVTWSWRKNGSTNDGFIFGNTHNDHNPLDTYEALLVVTDTSQTIEVKNNNGGAGECGVLTNGWMFPIGM